MTSIGIIGNGRFGDVLYKAFTNFSKEYQVKIYSRNILPDNQKFFNIYEVCQCDIVIPCVPISVFEEQIKTISKMISSKSLVVDVCSVSMHPAEVMQKYLTSNPDLLSTHPMFGPDSTENGTTFKNLKFIYFPLRIENTDRLEAFLEFWRKIGCEIINLSPREHDKQAAYTHAFAFLIGKIGMKMKIRKNYISTKGFEGILYNQTAVENDTGQLFLDMMTYNPYVSEMLLDFEMAFGKVKNELKID